MKQEIENLRAENEGNKKSIEALQNENHNLMLQVQGLQEKNTNLEHSVADLTDEVTNMNMVRAVPPFTFHIGMNGDRDFQDGTIINFDRPITNEGGHYDPFIGTFTCPLSGMYFFAVSLNSKVKRASAQLVRNGVPLQRGPLTSFVEEDQSGVSTQIMMIRCAEGDSMYVQAIESDPESIAASLVGDQSTFSGFLISQD